MSCTKHHEDITIEILAENYPKTIYNMVAFEFANTVANSTEVQGAECKACTTCIEKGSNGQTIITMQLLVENYPSFIYGMAKFEFEQFLIKVQKINRGYLQNDHTSICKGAKCKNTPPHAGQ